jgi:hypothetical protein
MVCLGFSRLRSHQSEHVCYNMIVKTHNISLIKMSLFMKMIRDVATISVIGILMKM